MTCLVRNLSATGAKLDIPSSAWLPERFDLEILHHDLRVPVKVVWRDETQLGVIFVKKEVGFGHSVQDANRITALEAERERLRLRVAQLSEA